MSLPTSDAQSSGFLPQQPFQHPQQPQYQQQPHHPQATPHSMTAPVAGYPVYPTPNSPGNPAPMDTPRVPSSPFPSPSRPVSMAEHAQQIEQERAVGFASSSWDLATGGLKTLTAKRQLPPLPERRLSEKLPESADADGSRNFAFLLVVLTCIVLMLLSAGVVLWIILFQP